MAVQISLGRDFSLSKYPSQRISFAIGITSALILLGKSLAEGAGLIASLQIGLYAYLASLVTWIIARELDPDRNFVAYIAQVLILIGGFYSSPIPLIFSALTIFSSRFLTKIAGLAIRDWEVFFAVGASFAIMFGLQNPSIALFLALLFVIDGQLKNAYQHSTSMAAISLAALLIYMVVHWPIDYSLPSANMLLVLGSLLTLALIRVARWKRVTSMTDHGHLPLQIARLKWSASLALFLPISSIWMGNELLMAYAPLLAALAAFSFPNFEPKR